MAEIQFKGIKQVLYEAYSGTTADEKKGFLWFVRNDSGSTGGDIYFGSRHYGRFDSALEGRLADIENELQKITTGDSSIDKKIENALAPFKLKDVKTDDKILANVDGVLSSAFSVNYDSTGHTIYFYGKDNAELGKVDTTDFVKDGMIDTAELADVYEEGGKFYYGQGENKKEATGVTAAGKYLRLHFNTDAQGKDVFVALNDLIDVYTGKDGEIVVDGSNVIGIADAFKKRVEALEAGKPNAGTDIKVADSGDTKNAISVSLSEDITVAGISDTYGCGLIKNGNTIPAGTSLSDILKMMLSKELNPKAATKPSIAISKTGEVSGLHEIGQVVNVGTATITKKSGQFNNNGWTSPAQPTPSFSWSDEKMTSKLTAGATGYAAQTDAASIAQGTATTVKGTNTVSITASAAYSAPTNKPITNLKKEYDGTDATWAAGTASASATITWTGVYPCFDNSDELGSEPEHKLGLQTNATFSVSVGAHNAGNNDYRFAYPDGWTISSFKVKSLDGKYYEFAAEHNKNAGDVTKDIQGNEVVYHYLTVANGESDYQIVLNKALNA